jgi:hypothetical protein
MSSSRIGVGARPAPRGRIPMGTGDFLPTGVSEAIRQAAPPFKQDDPGGGGGAHVSRLREMPVASLTMDRGIRAGHEPIALRVHARISSAGLTTAGKKEWLHSINGPLRGFWPEDRAWNTGDPPRSPEDRRPAKETTPPHTAPMALATPPAHEASVLGDDV